MDAYPDELVRDLIAHELAHVWQHATGSFATEGRDARARNEWDADELMECWGFDPYAMDEWDVAHGVIREIDTSGMSPERREQVERRFLRRFLRTGR